MKTFPLAIPLSAQPSITAFVAGRRRNGFAGRCVAWLAVLALAHSMNTRMPAAPAAPVDLRCEYLINPQGISTAAPRLSWRLPPGERGLRQSAYQLRVAGSAAALAKGLGDRWDSERVESAESIFVPYAGAPLHAGQECFWQVRTWDGKGQASAWSQPAHWSVGLLDPADWHARWIGLDETIKEDIVAGTQWIWHPERPEPPGVRYFRCAVRLPERGKVASAQLIVAADNQAVFYVNGVRVGRATSAKSSVRFTVIDRLKPGLNVLAASVQNMGEKPNPAGLLVLLRIEFADREPLVVNTGPEWKVAKDEVPGWEQTGFDDSTWVAARVVGPVGMKPWGPTFQPEDRRLPARWLRREFAVERKLRRATVYYSGMGLSELYLNGRKVGDRVLSPGLTDYTKRVFYVTDDVTKLLRTGANAVGVVLGNGRFFAPRKNAPTATLGYGFPKLCLELRLEYDDGTIQNVVSDASWRLTTEGPIRANNEYDGEDYDARMELIGWAEPGFDDSKWQRAQRVDAPGGKLVAEMIPPIRITGTLKPIAITNPTPGTHLIDFGQNLVGWCRITVRGPGGTEISLRHAEILAPDGTLYLENLRGAQVTDHYVLRGGGIERWEPRFTYHGFRYVEIRGWPGALGRDAIEACVVNDDLESAGTWASSQPLLNRILANVHWGVRGNYRSLPTDCPQRDERQGWLGDRSAEAKGETYLFQNAALYAKWIQDIVDAQKDTGSVPDVAPAYWPLYSDNVTWPSSLVLIPGALYEQFGDIAPIASAYPAMAKWIGHMSGFLSGDLMPKDRYGDWCVPPEDPKLIHSADPARKTAPVVLGTSYFYHCCRLMERYAALLGKPDDARRFGDLAARLREGFNRSLFKPEFGYYDNGTQTACVLPLQFGLVPDERRAAVVRRLTDKITDECRNHIGTGLIGGQWLMRTLSDQGRIDLAYTLATQKGYPSWGYMVEKGATTIWELWNGDTADPAMNSGNHVMLVGDLVIWFYEYLAGVSSDPMTPGFKHTIMRPRPVGDLTWVNATHESPYGRIASSWKREANRFTWKITVAPNTTATVFVPVGAADSVRVDGRPAATSGFVRFAGSEPGYARFEVDPGSFTFESSL